MEDANVASPHAMMAKRESVPSSMRPAAMPPKKRPAACVAERCASKAARAQRRFIVSARTAWRDARKTSAKARKSPMSLVRGDTAARRWSAPPGASSGAHHFMVRACRVPWWQLSRHVLPER
jgi:hypothetical protein